VVNALLAAESQGRPGSALVGSGAPRDEVERALLQARALVDAAMVNHRQRSATRSFVELAPDGETMLTTLRRLVATCRAELMCIMPAEPGGLERFGAVLPELGRRVAAGVSACVLCSPDTALAPGELRLLDRARALGVETRVAEPTLLELVLVDGRIALVRSAAGAAGEQALIARAPAILGGLRALFTGTWDAAIPAADYRRFAKRTWDELTQQVLAFLSTGYKDDVAARQLGMSVRTYRRYVAVILRDMGATSRFQAGVKAAELGLLPARALPADGPADPPSGYP
jgi:hypothetical protein